MVSWSRGLEGRVSPRLCSELASGFGSVVKVSPVQQNPLTAALNGVRVVEWSSLVSAPFCGKVLAELGAEVIKVEPPGVGEEGRYRGPFPDGNPHPERSGLFLFANLNKRGITLDLQLTARAEQLLERLLESADVFLENQPLALVEELGLDYESLKEQHPRLIVTSISPYGRSGPYRGYQGTDLTANAMSGLRLWHRPPPPGAADHATAPGQLPGRRRRRLCQHRSPAGPGPDRKRAGGGRG